MFEANSFADTLHDFRNTAASLVISAGANVQAMLGRASATITLDTYADLFDDALEAVAHALNSLRSAKLARVAQLEG